MCAARGVDEGGEAPEDFEPGRRLFARPCEFLLSAARAEQFPPSELPEVAFAGRSNVGKSSLLNALVGRNSLARVSRTPGRTQLINLFSLGGTVMLVDLPGYGYAKAPKRMVRGWTELVRLYLVGRPQLRRVYLLVDARHGLKEIDRSIMELLDGAAVSYQVTLTKTDKLSAGTLEPLREKVREELARRPAAHPECLATSSLKARGLERLRAEIAMLAGYDGER